ncbi:hypothetical protein AGLY_013698 [Aphis glycines]|uniref:Uncharacterized protein n=1 Tax=Aphis glycines TaxID=307491 RepID=A0A6G0T7E3_APHGL|nr:hypothetical protein AGLY_013698 [Aphis glycines]
MHDIDRVSSHLEDDQCYFTRKNLNFGKSKKNNLIVDVEWSSRLTTNIEIKKKYITNYQYFFMSIYPNFSYNHGLHKDKNRIGKQLSYTSILQQIKYNAICGNNRITSNLHKSSMGIRYSNEIKKNLISPNQIHKNKVLCLVSAVIVGDKEIRSTSKVLMKFLRGPDQTNNKSNKFVQVVIVIMINLPRMFDIMKTTSRSNINWPQDNIYTYNVNGLRVTDTFKAESLVMILSRAKKTVYAGRLNAICIQEKTGSTGRRKKKIISQSGQILAVSVSSNPRFLTRTIMLWTDNGVHKMCNLGRLDIKKLLNLKKYFIFIYLTLKMEINENEIITGFTQNSSIVLPHNIYYYNLFNTTDPKRILHNLLYIILYATETTQRATDERRRQNYVDSHFAVYPALVRDDQQVFCSVEAYRYHAMCATSPVRCSSTTQFFFLLIRSRNERPRHGSDVKRQGNGAKGSGQRNRVLSEKGGKNVFFIRVCDRLSLHARACVCFQTCTGETRRSHTVRAQTSNNTTGYDVSDVTMTSCPCKRLTLTTLREPVTLNGRIKTTSGPPPLHPAYRPRLNGKK